MQIKIFDNFLTKSYHEEILEMMSGFNFPWYYNDNISFKKGNKNLNEYGFSFGIPFKNMSWGITAKYLQGLFYLGIDDDSSKAFLKTEDIKL